jgi:hypothetical protein
MDKLNDIDLGNPDFEPTDEQLVHIGRKFAESVPPLPLGAVLPPLRRTDPQVWQAKMAAAMEEASKAYARITQTDLGDAGRP